MSIAEKKRNAHILRVLIFFISTAFFEWDLVLRIKTCVAEKKIPVAAIQISTITESGVNDELILEMHKPAVSIPPDIDA